MRHRKKFNHLSRKAAHRKAMLANMANSLILHKRIQTTVAKAKALRSYVEPLITRSKDDSTHSRRIVFSYLKDKHAVTELFREVSVKIADREGGYTRIIKTGNRLGDNADMCIIELVDYNENLLGAKSETKAKSTTRRSRRGGKAKPAAEVKEKAPVAEVKEEAPVVEEVKEETPVEEEVAEETKEEAPAQEVKEEAPAEEIVAEETPKEEPVADEAKEEAPAEEPKEEVVAEEKKEEESADEKKDEETK